MAFQAGHTPSHKGKVTTTEPIRDLQTIERIRHNLRSSVRDTALFSTALNSGLRAVDLCALQWSDVQDDGSHITLRVIERKTRKVRFVPLNATTAADLRAWRDEAVFDEVFAGQRGGYTVGSWSRIVKSWCADVGMTDHAASHTLRKSFVRLLHDHKGVSLTTLMVMLNHSSPIQTLKYMGKMTDDVTKAYAHSL